MKKDLTGRVIIITGASSGIGAATAVRCAKAGMNVVINARREERLRETAEEVRRSGREAVIVPGDVTEPGLSDRLLDAAAERFGKFDVVFANAGYGFEAPTATMKEEELRRIFEVNFFAAVDLIQKAAQRLLADRRRGHLLMCSSSLAKFTMPYYAAYTATKAAQNHFCRALRLELAPDGIEVSSVHPITTTTEFHQVAGRRSGRPPNEKGIIRRSPQRLAVREMTPRMFVQPPERVAREVVKCLARPRAEVWTNSFVRHFAGVMTMFPGLFDIVMKKPARLRREAMAQRERRDESS